MEYGTWNSGGDYVVHSFDISRSGDALSWIGPKEVSSTGGIYVQKDVIQYCGYPNGIFEYEDLTAMAHRSWAPTDPEGDLPMSLNFMEKKEHCPAGNTMRSRFCLPHGNGEKIQFGRFMKER